MDFQKLADSFYAPTCIISVEKKEDGGYGEIRLVAGNEKYIEPLEHPLFPVSPDMFGIPEVFHDNKKFIPNSLYERYLPKESGFEIVCYRSAVEKVPIHTYVHMNGIEMWFDIFVLPIDFEDGNLCYCSYTVQVSNPDDISVSSSQSGRTYEDVLKTCIKLHGANDFNKTLEEVIHEIRLICKAEVCTIALLDSETETCSVLAFSIEKNSNVKRITEFFNFYDIANSWKDIVGGNDCLIMKDRKDIEHVRVLNSAWYQTLIEANVNNFILFPLRYENEVLGYLWEVNFDTSNIVQTKEKLELINYFISSQISKNRMLERLKQISYTDLLTELPNRFACSEHLKELIQQMIPFTVVSMDINAFKSINETLGFETGNKVLIEISSRWRTIAESGISGTSDYIARLGGDEFALIIRDYHSEEDVLKTIRMYESALGNRLTIDNCDFYITASFGYAFYPNDSKNMDSLLTYADAATQKIKSEKSSNHILHFTPDLLKIERTLEVERKIREALESDTVYFHLQPQYDIMHNLRGFEALARMKDTDGNMISPGEFIPVAERVGLIDKVDGAVYRKSTEFFGNLLKKTNLHIMLSINVSVRHLMKNDFLEEIRNLLKTSGIPAEQLEIEITESIMIDSAEKALHCIDEIKKMGIKIAIDDFGTGYSSLSYLNSFPADLLKIDKSFIDKMHESESSRQYVSAIISMGHIMGFEVLSEGVEDTEQLKTLHDIGCDYIQGFVWGRPLPAEEVEKLVMECSK